MYLNSVVDMLLCYLIRGIEFLTIVEGLMVSGVWGIAPSRVRGLSDVQSRGKFVHFYLIICKLFKYPRSTALVRVLE